MSLPDPQKPAMPEGVDKNPDREDSLNVGELHGSILRENNEPHDGMEPVPLWLVLLFALIIFWSGGYLLWYSGGFREDVFDEYQVIWGPAGAALGAPKEVDPVAMGKKLYTANCASCHQPTGLGVAGQYPPLAGSEVVVGELGWGQNHLLRILLHGLAGPLKVKGNIYNGNMPAWGVNLKDEQIAYVLTYIRQEWGNAAPPISKEQVAAVRAEVGARSEPWSEAALKALPAKTVEVAASVPAATAVKK